MCTLKEPFETIPSHQKPCLNHAEKGHMPMYIEHIITYNSISIHSKQSQYNFINFLYNSDNPDSYYLLNFLNSFILIPPTMISPWQPSGCNARVSTAWGAATKASGPKLKTWAKSAEHLHFLMDNPKFWRRNSNLFDRKITLFDGQIIYACLSPF